MTKQEFLEKAKEKHGDKYEYPILNDKITYEDYVYMLYNNRTYCQKVCKHLMGRCPEKYTERKTTEEFIKEARVVWVINMTIV